MDAKDVVTPPAAAEELKKDEQDRRARLRGHARLMQRLLASEEWKVYLGMVEAVSQNYLKTALGPTDNLMEILKPEYAKGTLNGLSTAASLPAAKLREAAETFGNLDFLDAE